MTRDEALRTFRNSTPDPSSLSDGAWIDRFVALGMLKLEEPMNLEQRILESLAGAYVGASVRQPLEKSDIYLIMGWLQNGGLKIVEK